MKSRYSNNNLVSIKSLKITGSNSWKLVSPDLQTAFVIAPGAGIFSNQDAYKQLKQVYNNIVIIGRSGGNKDIYPDNWENNSFVLSTGNHLGGLCQDIIREIEINGKIPFVIICGSRGGQVTIGKVWETIWRGPTVIINAGNLMSNTIIPSNVKPVYLIMESYYFTTKSILYVRNKINLLSKHNSDSLIVFIKNGFTSQGKRILAKHMPPLDNIYYSELLSTLVVSATLLNNNNNTEIMCLYNKWRESGNIITILQ